jgi:hypothetical protein
MRLALGRFRSESCAELFRLVTAVALAFMLAGCTWFRSSSDPPALPQFDRPKLCILPFGIDVKIRRLSSIKTVTKEVSPAEEPQLVSEAVMQIRAQARQILYERVAGGRQFEVLSLKQTDEALARHGLQGSPRLTREDLLKLQQDLGVDLVLAGSILDYGKIRWQWAAAGMLGDLTWESVAIGLATSWNPTIILANVGFELLTSTPLWFGGAYVFGWAFRPVRVEAWATDPVIGDDVWNETEFAVYLGKALQELPEEDRKKKEAQLSLNLRKAVEALGESLVQSGTTKTVLWEHRLPTGPEMTPATR